MSAGKTAFVLTPLLVLVLAGSAVSQTSRPTASGVAVTSAHTARQTHRFRGLVTHSDRRHGWFQMRTTANKRVRIYTTHGTHWDGCDWDDMSNGHHVDVHAYRSHGHWIATSMANWHQWGSGGWGSGHWNNHGWHMGGGWMM